MAKKKKNREELPEGMSRRQAKLAARAAERAANERDPRPYAGLATEAELVALQEFVPSAVAQLTVTGFDQPVNLCTVLPGAVAALVREDNLGGDRYVALQVQSRSQNPGRDLAYALNWLKNASAGESLASTAADGNQPELSSLIDAATTIKPVAHQDFSWWLPEGAVVDENTERSLQAANNSIMPSYPVAADVEGAVWWIDAGDKAHIRWVRSDDEEPLLRALARIGAAGELNLGEDTKFAGVFRTHGIAVPVFDLDPTVAPEEYKAALEALEKKIVAEMGNDAELTSDERRNLDNIKSRQVTIR
jgi:hypothetical protein